MKKEKEGSQLVDDHTYITFCRLTRKSQYYLQRWNSLIFLQEEGMQHKAGPLKLKYLKNLLQQENKKNKIKSKEN